MALTSITDAIAAYNNAASGISGKASVSEDAATTSGAGGDFAALLQHGAEAAISAGKKSEDLSKQAITGKADIPDVVAAVSNAELTLQTVVAVRDKVVSAYNDIMRMSF